MPPEAEGHQGVDQEIVEVVPRGGGKRGLRAWMKTRDHAPTRRERGRSSPVQGLVPLWRWRRALRGHGELRYGPSEHLTPRVG